MAVAALFAVGAELGSVLHETRIKGMSRHSRLKQQVFFIYLVHVCVCVCQS